MSGRIGLIFLVILSLAQVRPALPTPYENKELKFGFTPPAGWTRRDGDSASGLVVAFVEAGAQPEISARRPLDDKAYLLHLKKILATTPDRSSTFQANITILVRKLDRMTLADYKKATREKSEKYTREKLAKGAKTTAYKMLSEKDRKLAGEPALERDTQVTLPNSPAMRSREVTCLHAGKFYTLTLGAPPGSFASYSAQFEKALASFAWLR